MYANSRQENLCRCSLPPGVPAPRSAKAALACRPLLVLPFFAAAAAAAADAAAAAAAAVLPSTERGAIDVGVEKASLPPSSLAPGARAVSLPLSLPSLEGEASSPPSPSPLLGVTQPPIPPPICCTRSLATAAPSGRAGEGGESSRPGTESWRCLRWKKGMMMES
jgi:hypothetical protein